MPFFTSRPVLVSAATAFLLNALVQTTKTSSSPLTKLATHVLPLKSLKSPLLTVFAVDMTIQALGFLHGNTFKTEKYYDLLGSLTYVTGFLYSLFLGRSVFSTDGLTPKISSRQQAVTTMGLMWCSRLGSFLFERVHKTGKDARFDKIKHDPSKFAFFWFMQGLWCFLVGMPVYLTNTNHDGDAVEWDWKDYTGRALFAFGWFWESLADYQKSQFKDANPNAFMSTGLFAYSRYPNYFGEIVLQFGLWLSCLNGIKDPRMRMASVASPLFTYFLLTKVSGIPPLEKSSMKKYGGDSTFQEYVKNTNILIPWFK